MKCETTRYTLKVLRGTRTLTQLTFLAWSFLIFKVLEPWLNSFYLCAQQFEGKRPEFVAHCTNCLSNLRSFVECAKSPHGSCGIGLFWLARCAYQGLSGLQLTSRRPFRLIRTKAFPPLGTKLLSVSCKLCKKIIVLTSNKAAPRFVVANQE